MIPSIYKGKLIIKEIAMSRCYYLKSENFINLDAVLEMAQKMINEDFTVKLDVFEPSEGEGGPRRQDRGVLC